MLPDICFPAKRSLMADGIAKALATADVTAEVDDAAALNKLEAEVDLDDAALARTSISYKSEIESAGDTSDDSSEAIGDSVGLWREPAGCESLIEFSLVRCHC